MSGGSRSIHIANSHGALLKHNLLLPSQIVRERGIGHRGALDSTSLLGSKVASGWSGTSGASHHLTLLCQMLGHSLLIEKLPGSGLWASGWSLLNMQGYRGYLRTTMGCFLMKMLLLNHG